VLPALLQFPQPRPRQSPFELEGEGPRLVVDRDSQHRSRPRLTLVLKKTPEGSLLDFPCPCRRAVRWMTAAALLDAQEQQHAHRTEEQGREGPVPARPVCWMHWTAGERPPKFVPKRLVPYRRAGPVSSL